MGANRNLIKRKEILEIKDVAIIRTKNLNKEITQNLLIRLEIIKTLTRKNLLEINRKTTQ